MPAEPHHAQHRQAHTASITRHRALQRPNRAKVHLRRMCSATRRCPETPGSLREPKGSPSVSLWPTHRVALIDERCQSHSSNELRTHGNAAKQVRGVRVVLGMRRESRGFVDQRLACSNRKALLTSCNASLGERAARQWKLPLRRPGWSRLHDRRDHARHEGRETQRHRQRVLVSPPCASVLLTAARGDKQLL